MEKHFSDYVLSHRTAIATIAVAVLIPIADGLRSGHVNWPLVGYAGLTALAGLCKSAIGK